MTEYRKPLPIITEKTKPYWEGCKRHELLIQRCIDCGTFRFYPRPFCTKCMSRNTEWVKVSGRGKVFTYTIIRRATLGAFANDVPYVYALIELEEGVRMASNIVGCKPEDVYIGQDVEVVFEDVTSEVTLPKFRPLGR